MSKSRNDLFINEKQIDDIINNPSPLYASILAADFAIFIAYAHFAINGVNFDFQSFHHVVIKKLEDIALHKNTKRNLGICQPVGSGKTLLVQYFIAWTFCRSINNAYIYGSHSDTNIMKLSREVKDMFSHPFLKALFKLELKKDEGSKTNWSFSGAINRTGLLATTIGTGSTGADAGNPNITSYSGALIIDDPVDVGKIRRPLIMNEVLTIYDEKLATRRRTIKTPSIVVMQRLTTDDLVAWLKKNQQEDWEFIEIPALDENDQSFWEERYPAEELKKIRQNNPFKFYAQYQQNPIALDDNAIFNRDSFRWYKELPQLDEITTSWDTAVKTKQVNDYSVCQVWGSKRNNAGVQEYYLIYVWRGKVLYPALKAKFKDINALYNPQRNIIEDKSAGETLIPDLKSDGYSNIIAFNVGTQDKVERAAIPSEIINQGRVYLPEDAPWLDAFLDEVMTFPSGEHDDQVDPMTQYLNWVTKPKRVSMGGVA